MGTISATGWDWDETRHSCDGWRRRAERRHLKRRNAKAQRRIGKAQINDAMEG
jgi:hypothetical protein